MRCNHLRKLVLGGEKVAEGIRRKLRNLAHKLGSPNVEVIATYGGHKLTSGQVMRELERLPPPSRTYLAVPERKRQFIDNMIMNDLLFDEGHQAGYDRDCEQYPSEVTHFLILPRRSWGRKSLFWRVTEPQPVRSPMRR